MNMDTDSALHLFRTMVRIREFEEAAGRLAEQAVIPGPVHLYAGQEAIAAAVCSELRPGDAIASTHRGHGHCIAKGADLGRMFAELFGRSTGYCKGKGGSMHIADVETGILGTNGIVAGGAPMAVGRAFASKWRKDGSLCVLFCGDGATNEGAWHEAMNLASLWKLPLLCVIENNHWGEWSRQEKQGAISRLSQRAASYGIPGVTVDGQDVLAVHAAAKDAIEAARVEGPQILEADTYRFYDHLGRSEWEVRPKDEIDRWRARDPIEIFAAWLADQGILSTDGNAHVIKDVRLEVEAAVRFGMDSPYPDPETDLLTDVYSA